jgi:hypothetical protein
MANAKAWPGSNVFERLGILLEQITVFPQKYISNSEIHAAVFTFSWKFQSDFVPMLGNCSCVVQACFPEMEGGQQLNLAWKTTLKTLKL